jgi:hypothetical protein
MEEAPLGSFVIVRVIALSPIPVKQSCFLVLSCGGQAFTTAACDISGAFCEQFVFADVRSVITVELLLRRPWPFFDKKMGRGSMDTSRCEAETVCCEAVTVGAWSLQVLLLRTTRREEEVCATEEIVDEEGCFAVPVVFPFNSFSKTTLLFFLPLCCKSHVCRNSNSNNWPQLLSLCP